MLLIPLSAAALVTIDTLRAQVSCTLCFLNIVLIAFSRTLATVYVKEDKMSKNLDALKRQVCRLGQSRSAYCSYP
jgi:hypothetical protein